MLKTILFGLLLCAAVPAQALYEAPSDSAAAFEQAADYPNALQAARRALALYLQEFGEDNSETLCSLFNSIGQYYLYTGEYALADSFSRRAIAVARQLPAGSEFYLVLCLSNRGMLLESTGSIRAAEAAYAELGTLVSAVTFEEPEQLASVANNLAMFWSRQGLYSVALPMFRDAIKLMEEQKPGDGLVTAQLLNNMGYCLYGMENFYDAEPYLVNAVAMYRRLGFSSHPSMLMTRNNLAAFYAAYGRYQEARVLMDSVLAEAPSVFTNPCAELAALYANMGDILASVYEDSLAESYLLRALNMRQGLFGKDVPEVITAHQSLTSFYLRRVRLNEASVHAAEALAIARRVYTKQQPPLLQALINAAFSATSLERYGEAERLYREARALAGKLYAKKNPVNASLLMHLAMFYTNRGMYKQAAGYFEEGFTFLKNFIGTQSGLLSEKELGKYINTIGEHFEVLPSIVSRAGSKNSRLLTLLADNRLLVKGLLLSATRHTRERVLQSGNEQLQQKFTALVQLRERIARLNALSVDELRAEGYNYDSLLQVANGLEKEVTRAVGGAEQRKLPGWKDIQKALAPGEAAVEIIHYEVYEKRWRDSVGYSALIITPGGKAPEIVQFTDGNALEQRWLRAYRQEMKSASGAPNGAYYDLFWKPIAAKLQGVKRVYLSADGLFYKINPATLYNAATGNYLGDEQPILLVNGLAELLAPERPPHPGTAAIFGNPDYALGAAEQAERAAAFTRGGEAAEYGVPDSLQRFTLAPLPGTEAEARGIDSMLRAAGWQPALYTGGSALEEAVKALRNPAVLVLSTHGYFLPDASRLAADKTTFGMQANRVSSNPLLRSGLFLAGAKTHINSRARLAGDDGVLTAYEAANLFLDSTQLVVLSACETGLGEVKTGEGVYGLQRAFRQAGAGAVLMSLWRVDDAATREFMLAFFKYMLAGKTKPAALHAARAELRPRYPHPYYWGAFVLLGR